MKRSEINKNRNSQLSENKFSIVGYSYFVNILKHSKYRQAWFSFKFFKSTTNRNHFRLKLFFDYFV